MFVGLAKGEVLVYDLQSLEFSPYSIRVETIFECDKRSKRVTDIKCHPDKMHRLAIVFENTGVAVYSINKDRAIYTIHLSADKDFHKGKALAVEWYSDTELIVGFSSGTLELYDTTRVGSKP